MAISRVIEVSFGRSSVALVRVNTAYFYNSGIIFKPTDIELPTSYQVHWADSPDKATTLETIGTAEGAPIPDDLWNRSRVIYGWIYLHPTEDSGITAYEVRIYKNVRAGLPDGTEPTPAEQSTIDQLIGALNSAVEQAEDAQEAIEDMSVSATTLAEGSPATVTKSEQDGVVHLAFGIPKGQTGDDGYSPTANVSKTGKVATITITDKNGTTSAQVEDGTDGIDGISPSVSVTDITGGHRVVITDKDGAKSFDVEDGATGATPNLTIGTVTTLEPDASATASITGTAEDPVLNLGIPRGQTGEVTEEEFTQLKEELSDVKIDVNELNAEIFTLSPTLTTNGFIKSSDGTIDASSYAKCTDFLDVVGFTSLYWTCENGSSAVARVAFYNTAKDFIANLAITSGSEGTVDLTQGIYANVRYVRVSYYSYPNKNFINFKCQLYKNNSVVATTDQYKKTTGYGTPINALIFGDSITECSALTVVNDKTTSYSFSGLNSYIDEHGDRVIYKMWPKLFEELVDCAEVRNYALSGASYKDQNDSANPRKSLSYQITLALNDLNNPNGAFTVDDFEPDVIILALGTNDQTPNDTPQTAEAKIIWGTDRIDIDATLANFDRSKFCEAVMWAYFTLRKHFPYALIICELPIQRMSNEIPLGTLHDYLELLAQKYGGAVIADGAYDSGIVRENNVQNGLGATLKDGLHPNPKGQNMLARLIIAKYYSSFVPFKDMNP